MSRHSTLCLITLIGLAACEALAAGSNHDVAPGTAVRPGKVSEWDVPTPKYPRDPAAGPDGNIYFVIMAGDRIARFDPKSQRFHEWKLPPNTQPRGLVIARDGKVIFGGVGTGTLCELDPASDRVRYFKPKSENSAPYTLALAADGSVWYTDPKAESVGKFDRTTERITEYPVGSGPYGLALDHQGNVWVTRMRADRVVKLDPRTGAIAELRTGTGSQPRRAAVSPDGMLWVALFGAGKLLSIDPSSNRIVKEYAVPGGANSGPYSVVADSGGRIWVSEIQTDNVGLLDPRSGTFQVFKTLLRNTGIRNATIDANGRFWYVGSHSGKLGVIE